MWQGLIRKTFREYIGLDRSVSHFQLTSGLRCPPGCGICCENRNVEASILECLPLADAVYRKNEADRMLATLDEKLASEDRQCVMFVADGSLEGRGRCSYYRYRPLVCRLFGFSSRKGKFGNREMCLCRVIKANNTEAVKRLEYKDPISVEPVYQDSFMRVAALNPDLGFKLFPINIAIQNALAYLFWKHPRNKLYKNAA